MGARRKLSAEYKREAEAMLDAPRVTVSQIASDLGIEANSLGRWRREVRQARANSRRSWLTSSSGERPLLTTACLGDDGAGFFGEKRQRSSRERRREVLDDRALP